jgi:acyl-[acyl-carrier-protein]-phospholipid O-acyltransferase/long-chain-fatty-acid--[acyl-carrier-protein] ligase
MTRRSTDSPAVPASPGWLTTLLDRAVRLVLWVIAHTVYRITIVGRQHLPARGPALLISNHISFIDGALIGACTHRFIRFMVHGPHYRKPGVHWLMRRLHTIPVESGGKSDVMATLERARAELAAGHVVCIFAEGTVSRTGNLLPFKRGFE